MEKALNLVLEKELADLENKRSGRKNARTAMKRTVDDEDDEDILPRNIQKKRFSTIT